jgi:hypothetical protein
MTQIVELGQKTLLVQIDTSEIVETDDGLMLPCMNGETPVTLRMPAEMKGKLPVVPRRATVSGNCYLKVGLNDDLQIEGQEDMFVSEMRVFEDIPTSRDLVTEVIEIPY